ncbi:MAG TPA: hypothetical protein VE860_05880, partial [Chthoniobacterales bacterium]|nr:hypothetical protein [Chthoniobacterales bacterium]
GALATMRVPPRLAALATEMGTQQAVRHSSFAMGLSETCMTRRGMKNKTLLCVAEVLKVAVQVLFSAPTRIATRSYAGGRSVKQNRGRVLWQSNRVTPNQHI